MPSFKTQTYRDYAGENESFIGWGWQDKEGIARFEKLGFHIERLEGHFYHLNHPHGETSSHAHASYQTNKREFERIEQLTRQALKSEIVQ